MAGKVQGKVKGLPSGGILGHVLGHVESLVWSRYRSFATVGQEGSTALPLEPTWPVVESTQIRLRNGIHHPEAGEQDPFYGPQAWTSWTSLTPRPTHMYTKAV